MSKIKATGAKRNNLSPALTEKVSIIMPQTTVYRRFFRRTFKALQKIVNGFIADDCLNTSAALSYYMAFSLAPILFILVLVAGSVFGEAAISGKIYAQTERFIGEQAASIVQTLLQNAYHGSETWLATVISIVTFLVGATTVFGALHSALNRIWQVAPRRQRAFRKLIEQRLLGLLMLLLIGILLVAIIIFEQAVGVIQTRFSFLLPKLPEVFSSWASSLLSYSVLLILFTLVFKFLSDARLRWLTSLAGAGFTTALFAVGKWAIGLYLLHSSLGGVYGAAGSFAVLLTWIYYSSAIFLLGAEFIKVYAQHTGDDPNRAD